MYVCVFVCVLNWLRNKKRSQHWLWIISLLAVLVFVCVCVSEYFRLNVCFCFFNIFISFSHFRKSFFSNVFFDIFLCFIDICLIFDFFVLLFLLLCCWNKREEVGRYLMLFQMDFFPTMMLLYSVYFKTIFIFFHFSSILSPNDFFVIFFLMYPPKYYSLIISPLLSNNSISTHKTFFTF